MRQRCLDANWWNYASYGGRGYWAMAVMAAIGLAAVMVLRRMTQPHNAGAGGETSAPS